MLLSDYESALIAAVKVVEYLHDMTVATVLLVQHDSEIVGNFLIKRFEEAFLVQLGVAVIDLLGDNIFVKSFKITFTHMAKIVHRRKLTVVTDKNYGLAVKNGNEEIKEGGFRNLVNDDDIDSLCTDINRVNSVFSKLLKLCLGKAITARASNAKHIYIVVEHSRVCLSIFFEDIGRFEILANVFEHRDSLLINSLCS